MKIDVYDLFTFLFVYLKLTDQITWSWFWVISPEIIGVILVSAKMIMDRNN